MSDGWGWWISEEIVEQLKGCKGVDQKIRDERSADVVSVDVSRVGLGRLDEVEPASSKDIFVQFAHLN